MTISLFDANRSIGAALVKAKELSIPISVSVCDAAGRLIAHQRMDGLFTEASHGSIGKAIASAGLGGASGDVQADLTAYSLSATVRGEGAPIMVVS